MKCRSKSLVRCGLVLTVATLSCATGCKSTGAWKMPSLFASREPDADKLAGNLGSTPPSPASKYAPTAIASKSPAGNATTKQSTQPSGLPYGNSSTASYTSPTSTSPTSPSMGTPSTTGGLAAQANGYQTGPYPTSDGLIGTSKPSNVAPTGLATSPVANNASQGFVSPYGGTYTGVGATNAPNLKTSGEQLPVHSLGQTPPSLSTPPQSGLPAYGSTPTMGSTLSNQTTSSLPAYPSLQNNLASGANSIPTNNSGGSIPAYPSLNSPVATATATATATAPSSGTLGNTGVAPSVSAYQSALPSGSYAPGTTGRTTTYNFAPSPSPSSNVPPQTRTLPQNTASGDQLLVR